MTNNNVVVLKKEIADKVTGVLKARNHEKCYVVEKVDINKVTLTRHKLVIQNCLDESGDLSFNYSEDKIGDFVTLKALPEVIDILCKEIGEIVVDFRAKEGVIIDTVNVANVDDLWFER